MPKKKTRRYIKRSTSYYLKRENFVSLITQDPFIREKLLKRTSGKCEDCGRDVEPLDLLPYEEWHVHHKSYKGRTCYYEEIQCENCFHSTPREFNKCMSYLVVLCKGCHFKRHASSLKRRRVK